MRAFIVFFCIAALFTAFPDLSMAAPGKDTSAPYLVKRCADFEIDGSGSNSQWTDIKWAEFIKIQPGSNHYVSKSKMMYSQKGIYLLFSGTDRKITTQPWNDFENIYDGDVFEVFFHPDPSSGQYFEYEINPLGKELVLTLARLDGQTLAWSPWPGEN